MTSDSKIWLAIGFVGQAVFTARFVVQWWMSEKKRNSVVPEAFWWLSLVGGAVLLVYASYKRDPVIIFGQSLGVIVYVRNLMLVGNARRRSESRLTLVLDEPLDAGCVVEKKAA